MIIVKTPSRGIPASANGETSVSASCPTFIVRPGRAVFTHDLMPTGSDIECHNFGRQALTPNAFYVVDEDTGTILHPL